MLVHTGQHYDEAMSPVFFEELGVGEPDYLLGVGSGTHGQQTARVLERIEPCCSSAPDILLVPGDVNSTVGASCRGQARDPGRAHRSGAAQL